MKLHCIVIALAFVNVLVITTADYLKAVLLTNLHINRALIFNAVEFQTIIKNLLTGDIPIDQITLMLAVPDATDTRNLQECIAYQNTFQSELCRITKVHAPQLASDEDMSIYTLTSLGKARRLIIKDVIKSIISAAIADHKMKSGVFSDFGRMCRLIGLFRSIARPKECIKKAEVDYYNTCTLTPADVKLTSQYRSCDDEIWEVKVDQVDEKTKLLSEQVRIWIESYSSRNF